MQETPINFKRLFLSAAAIVAVISFFGYAAYRYLELREYGFALRGNNLILEEKIAGLTKKIAGLEESLSSTTNNLALEIQEKSNLTEILTAEQTKNSAFEAQIRDISGTVGTLKKLSETDRELLKKYSKVYFLNENYAPTQLSIINSDYLYDINKPQLVHSGALPYLQGMLAAANRDGIKPLIVSAYRSFYEQISIKTGYKFIYGAGGANQFSADQGYSEHQLGTAVDFTTTEIKDVIPEFETSSAYKWLTENAYRFGFVLSYPKNNSYYQFEPWHWRFVGVSLATKIHSTNEYFYNLTQAEIDKYLISIFE